MLSGSGKFAAAAHCLLTILISMVKIRRVNGYANQRSHYENSHTLRKAHKLLFSYCRNKETDGHKHHCKDKVVCHLQMVRQNLPRNEEHGHHTAPKIFSTVTEHHSRYCGRNESKCENLPKVSGTYNNKEVRRESPCHRAENRYGRTGTECAHEYIESQKKDEHIHGAISETKFVNSLKSRQNTARFVARRYLISRHTTEKSVSPTGIVAGTFEIFHSFTPRAHAAGDVVARKYETLRNGSEKICHGYKHKQHNSHCVGRNTP